jgi:hypothetical protein
VRKWNGRLTRDDVVKALKAEGVRAAIWVYPEQRKYAIYSQAKWRHHPPVVPERMPGNDQINQTHLSCRCSAPMRLN